MPRHVSQLPVNIAKANPVRSVTSSVGRL